MNYSDCVKTVADLKKSDPHLFQRFPETYPNDEDAYRLAAALWPGAIALSEIERAAKEGQGMAIFDPDIDTYMGPILPEEVAIVRALWTPGPPGVRAPVTYEYGKLH